MNAAILGTLLLMALPSLAQNSQPSANIRVPDAATALSIAEPALIKVYGKRQIEYERPLRAVLDEGIWNVFGTDAARTGRGGAPAKSANVMEGPQR